MLAVRVWRGKHSNAFAGLNSLSFKGDFVRFCNRVAFGNPDIESSRHRRDIPKSHALHGDDRKCRPTAGLAIHDDGARQVLQSRFV